MPLLNQFSHVGVSTRFDKTRVRFTNNPHREIILVKDGHDDITILELPEAMYKGDAVTYLMTLKADFSLVDQMAIDEANDRYNTVIVKNSKAKVATKTSKEDKLAAIANRKTDDDTDDEIDDTVRL